MLLGVQSFDLVCLSDQEGARSLAASAVARSLTRIASFRPKNAPPVPYLPASAQTRMSLLASLSRTLTAERPEMWGSGPRHAQRQSLVLGAR